MSDHVHVWLSCCDICGIVSPNAVLLRDTPADRRRLADIVGRLQQTWDGQEEAADVLIDALRGES